MLKTRDSHLFQTSIRLSVAALALFQLACAGVADNPMPSASPEAATPAENKVAVRIVTKRDGDVTRFYVENNELCETTMTFEVKTVNLQAEMSFPCTMTFAPQQTTRAFTLKPVDPAAVWDFSYTNYYKLGSQCAVHDDNFIYHLPYAPGDKFRVTQGYNGKFSHKGSNQYAIDWKMPQGTPVYAARGGLVVKIKDDSDRGGASMEYDHFNNYVLIRHDDGTLGHYCHLKKGGVVVQPGDRVATGQLIAHSGNTGFSSGAHLHFCVFKTRNGRERESIPVQFETATDAAITLTEGHTYRSVGIQTIASRPAKDGQDGQGSAGQ
jgi:murein DD-endopeptidase MepM/ murein hydrolase activator NlpD